VCALPRINIRMFETITAVGQVKTLFVLELHGLQARG
jgi:hypothetical protein